VCALLLSKIVELLGFGYDPISPHPGSGLEIEGDFKWVNRLEPFSALCPSDKFLI